MNLNRPGSNCFSLGRQDILKDHGLYYNVYIVAFTHSTIDLRVIYAWYLVWYLVL